MATPINRDVRLTRRPSGMPSTSDFELAEGPIPTAGRGQILVRNLFMSVDPYMRGRMSDRKSYATPYQVGEVMHGGAVGKVVTGNDRFAAGTYVLSQNGWREWFVSDGADLVKIDPSVAPVQAYLGVLGMTGMTAYVGLTRIGEIKAEDRVFVSGAAGAVGSVAIQIARAKGCEIVVGSAGTDEKCAWLRQIGASDAINYKIEDIHEALGQTMPGGIDLYFENVGGAHLEAALDHLRQNGRIAVCGLIDGYNATKPGPRNLMQIIAKRLTIKGFLVLDHFDLREQFHADMRGWIAAGKITWRETVVDGIENAVGAFLGLFQGANTGKMLVKLAEDD